MSEPTQLPLAFEHRPALGGEDFLVADCNRDAVAWLDRWPDWPAPLLVLSGQAGSGKTHLAHVFLARTKGRLMTAGQVLQADPVQVFEDAPTVVLEDVDAWLTTGHEQALFHLYNAARDVGRHLLMTAITAPIRWQVQLPDLRSRLLGAPGVTIGAPDDALIEAVLVKLLGDRQLRVEAGVIAYLAPRMERTFDAARRLVDALDREALMSRRNITVPLARAVLAGLGDGGRGS